MTNAAQLDVLIDGGLTFGECLSAFAKRQGDTEKAYVERAREQWARDGEIEIDDNAIVSGSEDNGDYVLAWVWVSDNNTDDDDHDGEVSNLFTAERVLIMTVERHDIGD